MDSSFINSKLNRILAQITILQNQVSCLSARTTNQLGDVQHTQESVMTAIENLTAAVDDLAAKIADHDIAVQAELQQLATALEAGDNVAVQAAADRISTLSTQLAAATTALQADDPVTNPL